jgi:lipid-A-disaccharide synthase
MARVIDHVLALLPFEPPYMQAAGMTCDFVGHPVVAEPQATPEEAADFRARHGIDPQAPVVLCLPGSRRSEVDRLAPRFGEALRQMMSTHGDLRVVLPTVAHLAEHVRTLTSGWHAVAGWRSAPIILDPRLGGDPEKRAAFAAADVALAASGTVSLELAAARVPMVIGYDFSRLTWEIMRRLARIDTVTLVNLVTQSRAVPEFLGPHDCQPAPLRRALNAILRDSPERAAQLAALDLTMDRLGRGDEPPGLRAARSVLSRLG